MRKAIVFIVNLLVVIATLSLLIGVETQKAKKRCPRLGTMIMASTCEDLSQFPSGATPTGAPTRRQHKTWCCFIQKYKYSRDMRKKIGYCTVGYNLKNGEKRARWSTSTRNKCGW